MYVGHLRLYPCDNNKDNNNAAEASLRFAKMNVIDSATIIWIVVGLCVVFPISVVFAVSPQTVVRVQAHFCRTAYKSILNESDEKIDEQFRLPWDRALMGKRSEFITRGSENPEAYKGLTRYYRAFGIAILLLFGCAFFTVVMMACLMGNIGKGNGVTV